MECVQSNLDHLLHPEQDIVYHLMVYVRRALSSRRCQRCLGQLCMSCVQIAQCCLPQDLSPDNAQHFRPRTGVPLVDNSEKGAKDGLLTMKGTRVQYSKFLTAWR